jgi:ribonuclease HI
MEQRPQNRPKRQRVCRFILRFDGGCRGNPGGETGSAWVLTDGETGDVHAMGWRYQSARPGNTNNTAEYGGLIDGLTALVDDPYDEIIGDSNLVVKQVTGAWRVLSEHLQPLKEKACEFMRLKPVPMHHERRKSNGLADSLANYAMNTKTNCSIVRFAAEPLHVNPKHIKSGKWIPTSSSFPHDNVVKDESGADRHNQGEENKS